MGEARHGEQPRPAALAVPDVSLRYILEDPRFVLPADTFQESEAIRHIVTRVADRDLALANHVTAGLALATWLHIWVLQDPVAMQDAWAWASYRAWLQLLKSLHGRTLEAALMRIRGEVQYVPVPVAVQQPQQRQGILGRLKSLVTGGG